MTMKRAARILRGAFAPCPLVGLACVSLYLVYVSTSDVSLFLHMTLRPFFHGVSGFKIGFALLFTALLALVVSLPWRVRAGRLVHRLKAAVAIAVAGGLIANFLSFAIYMRRFSLPFDRHVFHFRGNYNSVNHFIHIHTGKAAIANLLDSIGLHRLNEICDTGGVFLGHVSFWLIAALSVFTVAAFALLILLARPALDGWTGGRRAIALMAYAFAGAQILKCMLDGGPLSRDLLPASIAMHLLLSSSGQESLVAVFNRWRPWYLLAVAAYLGVCAVVSSEVAVFHLLPGLAFMFAVYFLLFIPLAGFRRRSFGFCAAALLSLGVMAVYWYSNGLSRFMELYQRVGERDRIIKLEQSGYAGAGATIAEDHSAKMRGKSLAEVYRLLGNNPVRNRSLAVKRYGEDSYTDYIFVLKVIAGEEELVLGSNEMMTINSVRPYDEYGEKAYLFDVSFNPEAFPALWGRGGSVILYNNQHYALHFLNCYFLARGLNEYALVPLYYRRATGAMPEPD